MMLLFLVLAPCWITLTLLIWFKSDAIVEYGSLIGLSSVLRIDRFRQTRISIAPQSLSYPAFLRMQGDNFMTRLINCPLCLSIWISSLLCLVSSGLILNPIFLVANAPIVILTLILYGIITKLVSL